jgi:predicted metal-dependent hydrolase
VDPISASTPAPVEAPSRSREDLQALAQAMIKLLETCAAAGRDSLPPDATYHTYA